ncbi:MAG TPA: alkaline phosphatase family protein [Gemmatimonadaceae bacterium]|nr:alkaline phosphatase family protein [Gemmatimonadaceae bacterium]
MHFRSLVATSLVFAIPTTATAQASSSTRAPSPGTPTLVLVLTVDQMRPDYFTRFGSQLTGGLGRLYRGGAVFLSGWQDHAITETAPGHASILSGRFPRSTGIATNSAGVLDSQAPLINGGGSPASPFRFRGTTLTDWMRMADPRTRALSVSRKDRGAILPLGRAKQNAFWYSYNGAFTTSRYYADTLPTWVQQFNDRRLPQAMHGRKWELALPESSYPERDDVKAESGGQDYVFPHVLSDSESVAVRALPDFPWMDELTLSFALAGVRALDLGAGPQPDVLAVSLSTTDAIGHRYGPDSREIHDQIIRLDRALGAFLDTLFTMRDSTRVIIALTADHGVTPLPEAGIAGRPADAHRVSLDSVLASIRAGLAARHIDTATLSFEEGVLRIDRNALRRAGVSADSVARRFAAAARRVPGVARADDVAALANADTVHDAIARRWLHSLIPGSNAAVVVTLRPYDIWGPSTVAMHGQPSDLDARVPIIFYGAPFRRGVRKESARVVDIAPTLANVLGVAPAERLDGVVLRGILH